MDDETWDTTSDAPKEVEHQIYDITSDYKDLQFGLHSVGKSYANHFSDIKYKYKNLSTIWLTYLLIGLLFITESTDKTPLIYTHFNKLYIDALLTVLAILGVQLLKFLDVKVYHQQLKSIFLCMLTIEKTCAFLDKEFTTMAKLLHRRHFDPVMFDSLRYSIVMVIIASLGMFALFLKYNADHDTFHLLIIFTIYLGFLFFEIFSVFRSIWWGASRHEKRKK